MAKLNILDLPNEILVQVFQRLPHQELTNPKLSQVCPRFQAIQMEILKHLEVLQVDITKSYRLRFLSRCTRVKHLQLDLNTALKRHVLMSQANTRPTYERWIVQVEQLCQEMTQLKVVEYKWNRVNDISPALDILFVNHQESVINSLVSLLHGEIEKSGKRVDRISRSDGAIDSVHFWRNWRCSREILEKMYCQH